MKNMHLDGPYEDIIDLPHYEPKNHTRMTLYKRAAQFAPFSALTGYDDEVKEAARHTDRGIELSEDETEQLDRKWMALMDKIGHRPLVTIIYFKPDERKEGGAFLEASGRIQKIDSYKRELVMEDGCRIPFRQIIDLDSNAFSP